MCVVGPNSGHRLLVLQGGAPQSVREHSTKRLRLVLVWKPDAVSGLRVLFGKSADKFGTLAGLCWHRLATSARQL